MSEARIAVVLGMHRSGTSLVSRSLQVFGFGHGERLMQQPDNAKGHWEDLDLVAFNDTLLEQLGKRWYSLAPLSPSDQEQLRNSPLQAAGAALISSKLAQQPALALKDPRMTLLLPFWQPLLASLNLQPTLLLSLRRPLEVAQSLNQRDGFALERGLLLWLNYNLSALRALQEQGLSCWLIDYNQLLQDPQQELLQLSRQLELGILHNELHTFCQGFVDASLNHHASASPQALPPGIDSMVNRLEQLLQHQRERQQQYGQMSSDPDDVSELQALQKEIQTLLPLLQLNDLEFDSIATARAQQRQAQAELEAVRAELQKLHHSTSWRLTQPLRSIKDWLKPAHHQSPC